MNGDGILDNCIMEKIVLHKVLNSKKYNWNKKINSYGTDITILDIIDSSIRDETTKKFRAMMLHDKKANNFICSQFIKSTYSNFLEMF